MKTLIITLAALIMTTVAQANTEGTGFVCKGIDSPIKLKILFHEDSKASTLIVTPKAKQVFESTYAVGGMNTRYGYEMKYTSQITPNIDLTIWLQAHEYSSNYTTIISWLDTHDKKYELKCVGFPKSVEAH